MRRNRSPWPRCCGPSWQLNNATAPPTRDRQALLSKLAERIAVNRTVAGVHYPIDTWCGAVLGRAVGQIVLAKCRACETIEGYRYRAHGDLDFSVKDFLCREKEKKYGVERMDCFKVGPSPLFEYLWGKACQEFDLHDGSR